MWLQRTMHDGLIGPGGIGHARDPGRAARGHRVACTGAIALAAALLSWPALYSGYPLVFADTGTYLSQAIERYLGWDRPVFYSLFLLPLHLTLTTWPAIFVQALLVAHTLHLLRRTLLPGTSPLWLVPLALCASLATALPWFAAQLMPDIFTPLLILVLALLVFVPQRLSANERCWLVLFGAFMVATQQSSLLLSAALLGVLAPLRHRLGSTAPLGPRGWGQLAALPALAVCALVAVNLLGKGKAAISPYGNVFVLARIIYDGPGRDVLRQDCPQAGWRLCPFIDRLPDDSDGFLWQPDSPMILAGGHQAVSADANAIIMAALRREPGAEALAFLHNALRQLSWFATGDGLQAWPQSVGARIARDFPPFEFAAYRELAPGPRPACRPAAAAAAAHRRGAGRNCRLRRGAGDRAAAPPCRGGFRSRGAARPVGQRRDRRRPVAPASPLPEPRRAACPHHRGAGRRGAPP